jgi:uncharacterized membrane protein YraQ (UPF0718 family)
METFLRSCLDLLRDSYTIRVIIETGHLAYSILPGLIVGLTVSSFLTVYRPGWFHGRPSSVRCLVAVPLFAFLGVVSPFCSYLAIPICASMIAGGMVSAPVFAFLFATPLMNPNLFFMTWSAFGWPMAIARLVAAFGFGLLGGILAYFYSARFLSFITPSINQTISDSKETVQAGSFGRRWLRCLRHQSWFVLKYVTLGIVIAAVIKEIIPLEWIETAMGRSHGYSVLAGALLGVPLYACGGGSIPIIQVLVSLGMSPGAALAFFIAGPATKIPNLLAMRMTMGWIVTGEYFILSLTWSVACGVLFQVLMV